MFGHILICKVKMYFRDMKEVTLSPQGENSPFRKIVTPLKLLFCEIYLNMVYEIRGGQNLR